MAANTATVMPARQALDLDNIRATLQRMEDSIIFGLIERAQFSQNLAVYEPDCEELGNFKLHELKSAGSSGCLGDWFIYQSECLHAQVGRYELPTEFSFFGPLPEASLGPVQMMRRRSSKAAILADVPEEALINRKLLDIYRTRMMPALCEEGDDGNHGSTALQDVHCLQTIATRCYYGLFVAESKFRSEREKAVALIQAQDREGLTAFITKPEVEERNIRRVVLKARTFSQNIGAAEAGQLAPLQTPGTTYKVDPEYIGAIFREYVMPLTRDVEVEYLLRRLDSEPEGMPGSSAVGGA